MVEPIGGPTWGRRAVGWVLLVLSLGGIAAVTLLPEKAIGGKHFRWGLSHDPEHLAEDMLNAILFMPLGVALERMGRSFVAALATSAAISTAIEMSQLYLIPGRFAELQDILANTAGGLIGWGLAMLAARSPAGR
ncbi:MAG: VanZ family protein [Gemmatimonadaceae bacterium]|nr:VanZ family protein [Gemmatimonadaceae bacterium]NUQ91437.1 VanZ family protein [Gemmatimonadaceae bacterium]NUR20275.1 VanZ family protein [Gemmatimonadaceae bacterium]NUS97914.1 VanZ family protein [Gemmatimonadaceae bacterium]